MQYLHHEAENVLLPQVGGKAFNLYRLKAAGLTVPEWIVVPAEELQKVIGAETDPGLIRQWIEDFEIPPSFIRRIRLHFGTATFFAVRSSALDEDGTTLSFAGQFETYLYVKPEQLAENIKKVWLSACSERVLAYRKNNGLNGHFSIAVIIQRMVNADAAGVAFGADPLSGRRDMKVISAVYGLGEGLVSGELNADTFRVKGAAIEATIANKPFKIAAAENSGTCRLEVEAPLRKQPALSDDSIFQLAGILDRLQALYGQPQDIEFAIEHDKIYLLQSRAITGLKTATQEGEYIVWDNSNIIESYPGVTTPLTFSFIIKVYEAVYRQMASVMGISQKDIELHKGTFANMLGLLNGRVYYNLLSWYKLLALLPGYSLNAAFMEKMMGVKERFELKDHPLRSGWQERLRIGNMVWVMLRNLLSLPGQRKQFVHEFNEVMKRYQGIEFDKCRPEELMRLYYDFEQTLLKKWKAPLVNDFFTMIYFGVLQKVIEKYKIDATGSLHNDLLSGAKDIISTEPVWLIMDIVEAIQNNEQAKHLFINNEPGMIWQSLTEPEYFSVKRPVDEFIASFGERCVGELKLETVSYKQDPLLLVRILKQYTEQGVRKNANTFDDKGIRREAEAKAELALKGKPLQRMIFQYLLKQTRILVSSRENLRYERTRAFGIVRQIFNAMGKQFHKEGILAHSRDIFYLKKEEIFEYIQGTSVNNNLSAIIDLRKAEFAAFEHMQPAERIVTHGMVYHNNDLAGPATSTSSKPDGDLSGIGCCAGRVKAKVRVLRRPDEISSLEGDILVTSSTDPGWAILFPTASGILVERGSLLSHSAIVSREMGIPCIVGITGLLDRLQTGDMVEMDGKTGEVKIV